MNSSSEERVLIAVSVDKITPEPYIGHDGRRLRSVSFRANSVVKDACFTRQSGPLLPELMPNCEKLQRHGFTVVEAPQNWRWGYFQIEGGWQTLVLQQAVKQVEGLPDPKERGKMTGYDEELARRVLEAVGRVFRAQLNMAELKHELSPEPSDEILLTALDALLIDKLIEGPHIRSGFKNELRDVALVRITSEGRKHFADEAGPASPRGTVIKGDQINNDGNAAAMGRHAVGTINRYQYLWSEVGSTIDTDDLTRQLVELRTKLQETAKTREDYRQLGIVAEAEEHAEKKDGGRLLETLSKAGKEVLHVAEKIGVEVAAKVISKAIGVED